MASRTDANAPSVEPKPAAPATAQDTAALTNDPERLRGSVEAVLLAVDRALAPAKIAEAAGLDAGGAGAVREAIDRLNAEYDAGGRSFRIEQVAGGYRVMTRPEFAGPVAAIRGMRESHRLSRAALETLAIVAYRQPITRVQIESIRGVACGEVLRTLLERRLIAIAGRADELGRPMLYGTSRHFLEQFGLSSVRDLPPVGDVFPELDASAPPASPDPDVAGADGNPGVQPA